ncbi:MAG: hypothetical protein ACI9FJ_000786 [Alteromonadaceae bacterium]|jgi:hypothetical protein
MTIRKFTQLMSDVIHLMTVTATTAQNPTFISKISRMGASHE